MARITKPKPDYVRPSGTTGTYAGIRDNAGTTSGPAGFAQGGGIWNDFLFNPLFTEFPLTLENSRIEKNTPDDCFGC
jgi:hypothetical protein